MQRKAHVLIIYTKLLTSKLTIFFNTISLKIKTFECCSVVHIWELYTICVLIVVYLFKITRWQQLLINRFVGYDTILINSLLSSPGQGNNQIFFLLFFYLFNSLKKWEHVEERSCIGASYMVHQVWTSKKWVVPECQTWTI